MPAEDELSVTVHHQARFTEDGAVSAEGEVTATSLDDFGVAVDGRERETRLDQPEASEFGIDDRPCVNRSEAGEQVALFVDVDEAQQTLTGESAGGRCRFTAGEER